MHTLCNLELNTWRLDDSLDYIYIGKDILKIENTQEKKIAYNLNHHELNNYSYLKKDNISFSKTPIYDYYGIKKKINIMAEVIDLGLTINNYNKDFFVYKTQGLYVNKSENNKVILTYEKNNYWVCFNYIMVHLEEFKHYINTETKKKFLDEIDLLIFLKNNNSIELTIKNINHFNIIKCIKIEFNLIQ